MVVLGNGSGALTGGLQPRWNRLCADGIKRVTQVVGVERVLCCLEQFESVYYCYITEEQAHEATSLCLTAANVHSANMCFSLPVD